MLDMIADSRYRYSIMTHRASRDGRDHTGAMLEPSQPATHRVAKGRSDGRLYLRVGDEVNHRRYPQWGRGVVVEERTSTLGGGLCLVRVVFTDGQERSFINNFDDQNCCYYAGLRIESS
jgi:hypothetical protein